MLYNPPTGGAANDPYVGANIAAGIQGSKVPPGAVEFPQRELISLITAAGLAPTNTDLQQATRAVRSGILEYAVDVGAVNAPAITPSPAHTQLVDGLHVRVRMQFVPTGPTNLSVSSLVAPVQYLGGKPLVGGDWAVNDVVDLVYCAPRNAFQFLGLTISQVNAAVSSVINNIKIVGSTPKQYASAGSYTLAVAAGVTFNVAECRGSGGGGGGCSQAAQAASGGGGGGWCDKLATTTAATVLAITVGAPGGGGAAGGGNGSAGGTTSVVIQSGSVTDAYGNTFVAGQTLCASTGGTGGVGATTGGSSPTTAGVGGVASGGDLNYSGDNGGLGIPLGSVNAQTWLGGAGGLSPGSGGSPQPSIGGGNSSSAAGTGGNGGSSANAPGGPGTTGRVTIYK